MHVSHWIVYSLTIDADSEAWVGAWWLGPLVASGFMVVMAMPMLGFPRRLPGIGVINFIPAGMLPSYRVLSFLCRSLVHFMGRLLPSVHHLTGWREIQKQRVSEVYGGKEYSGSPGTVGNKRPMK